MFQYTVPLLPGDAIPTPLKILYTSSTKYRHYLNFSKKVNPSIRECYSSLLSKNLSKLKSLKNLYTVLSILLILYD